MVLRKSFYIRWSAGRSPRVHEVNPGRDPSTVDLMVSMKVSRECHTIFKFVNTSRVGRGMSRKEMSIQWNQRWRAFREVLYIGTAFSKKKKKRQWYQYHSY